MPVGIVCLSVQGVLAKEKPNVLFICVDDLRRI